jgi:hypothetical protein
VITGIIYIADLALIVLYNIFIYLVFKALLEISYFIIDRVVMLSTFNNKTLLNSKVRNLLIIKDYYQLSTNKVFYLLLTKKLAYIYNIYRC